MKSAAGALALVLLSFGGTAAHAAGQLDLYKMVRSLQLVQDRLAGGDHAALPMQQKLLEMTDERFRTAGKDEFDDPRNITALLVYAMSGGNPMTIEVVVSKLDLEGDTATLAKGVLAYMKGRHVEAGRILAPIEAMQLGSETGAFVALVKGSIVGAELPEAGLKLMDQARLLAPGTLVEEAALRRSLSLVLTMERPDRFLVLAEQYTRRFLRSPYASEFADAFVEGMVKFHDAISEEQIERIVSLMSPAQQEAIYLRLARRSTIKGQIDRSAFASDQATMISGKTEDGEDPRATLYYAIASITSENVEEVLANLEKVDPAQLSPRDRRLLLAARAIATEVLAPPEAPVASAPVAVVADDAGTEPQAVAAKPVTAADAAAISMPAPEESDRAGDGMETETGSSELVNSVRAKLEAIDRLLEEEKVE